MYHTSYLHNCFRVVLVPTSTNVSEIHLFFNYCSHAKHSPWQRVEVVLFTVILQTVVSHWKASSLTVAEGQHSLRWVWHSLQKQPFLKLEAVLFQYIRYQPVQKVWTVYCTLLLLNCNWTELQRAHLKLILKGIISSHNLTAQMPLNTDSLLYHTWNVQGASCNSCINTKQKTSSKNGEHRQDLNDLDSCLLG